MPYIPSNIKEWSKDRGILPTVRKVAGWVEKTTGRSLSGGTAIGKQYGTLILDIAYHGSEIYIDCENDTVELFNKQVASLKEFKTVWAAGFSCKQFL